MLDNSNVPDVGRIKLRKLATKARVVGSVTIQITLNGISPFIKPVVSLDDEFEVTPMQLALCIAKAARGLYPYFHYVNAESNGGFLELIEVIDTRLVAGRPIQKMVNQVQDRTKVRKARFGSGQANVWFVPNWMLKATLKIATISVITEESIINLLKLAGSEKFGLGANRYGLGTNGAFGVSDLKVLKGTFPVKKEKEPSK